MSEIEKYEKQSSIEVNQNNKGEYAFHVKIYFNEEQTPFHDVNERITDIYNDLHKRFG